MTPCFSFSHGRAGNARRQFIKTAAGAVLALPAVCRAAEEVGETATGPSEIVDIHVHCTHRGRSDEQTLLHQKNTGVGLTVLLPAGTTGGLAAGAAGTGYVAAFAQQHPGCVYFANENIFRPEAPRTIERWLEAGACGIGELKDRVACDSPGMMRVAEVAREHGVPMLIHFQDGSYNDGFARFYRVLEKFPTVNFIGHATAFWGNIDRGYTPVHQRSPYPKNVTPGGLTDKWLAEYPNLYGDISAGSGNRALSRDPEFTKDFLTRHQDKLLYGSDCFCPAGTGPDCRAVIKLGLLERLCATGEIRKKILADNSRKLLRSL
ncbi:MAG: amidohydrolase family protein [Opitutaceae bacterium]